MKKINKQKIVLKRKEILEKAKLKAKGIKYKEIAPFSSDNFFCIFINLPNSPMLIIFLWYINRTLISIIIQLHFSNIKEVLFISTS